MPLKLSDITVRRFMKALFDKDYEGIDNCDEIYTLYIDTSGLGEEGQLGMYVAIHNLNVRLVVITGFLEYQSKIFKYTNTPKLNALNDINKYGHRLIWDPANPDSFLPQLTAIEAKEKRNYVEIKKLNKELQQMKDAEKPNTVSARNSFIIMLNMLRKEGYKIDKDKTDMEELSLIIKQHGNDVRAIQNQA